MAFIFSSKKTSLFFVFASVMACSALAHEFSILGYAPEDLTSIYKVIHLFESWLVKHSKIYESLDEKLHRFEIFMDNLKHIDETNKKVSNYWLGLNEFADLTHEEFKNKFLGLKGELVKREDEPLEQFSYRDFVDLPKSVDWRKKGAVAPVKNQGQCEHSSRSYRYSSITMTNTRNQEIDNILKEHGKAISDLQETLVTLLKRQEQSLKQQEEILRAFKERSSGGGFSCGGGGGSGTGLFSEVDLGAGSRPMRVGKVEFPRFSGEDVEGCIYRWEQSKAANETIADESVNGDDFVVALHSEGTEKLQAFEEDVRKLSDTVCTPLADATGEESKTRLNKVVKMNLRIWLDEVNIVHQSPKVKNDKRLHILPVENILEGDTGRFFSEYLKPKASSLTEWHPPWRFTMTSPIATERTEWCPPW